MSITKAAIENDALLALVSPELTASVVNAVFNDMRIKMDARVYRDGMVSGYAEPTYSDQIQVYVNQGRVTVQASNTKRAEELTEAVSKGIASLAEALLGQQIAATLNALVPGKQARVTEARVTDGGQELAARIFTLKI